MKKLLFLLVAVCTLVSCKGNAQEEDQKKSQDFEVSKSESEWKRELSDAQFKVLRKQATERAFSSDLLTVKGEGTFVCAACENPVYENKYKFESGTGWPSFDRAIEDGVEFGADSKLGYQRDEVHCAKCGGHLGHIFNDGPKDTTGKRHCINGVAMNFKPAKK